MFKELRIITSGRLAGYVIIMLSLSTVARAEEKVVTVPEISKVSAHEDQSEYDIPSYQGNEPSKYTNVGAVVTSSPETALRKAWQEEQNAVKVQQQLEYETVAAQSEFQRKKTEAEIQINIKRKKIYDLKQKEDESSEEIERMRFELVQMEQRLKVIEKDEISAQEREKVNHSKFSGVKGELDQSRAKLAEATSVLKKTREETGKKINAYLLDMQKFRSQISNLEADIARTENDRARVEAEELQTRTQWAAMTTQLMSLKEENERTQVALLDAKVQLEKARGDSQIVKNETQTAEKEKQALEQEIALKRIEVSSELKKIEGETVAALHQKAFYEAEKASLVAEIEKLQMNLGFAKHRNEEVNSSLQEGEGSLNESRLAFETVKASLAHELASMETLKLRRDASLVRQRSLASTSQTSLTEGQKSWVASKTCSITRSPVASDIHTGKINSGDHLIASFVGNGYIKILNASGRPEYVPSECGRFTE